MALDPQQGFQACSTCNRHITRRRWSIRVHTDQLAHSGRIATVRMRIRDQKLLGYFVGRLGGKLRETTFTTTGGSLGAELTETTLTTTVKPR